MVKGSLLVMLKRLDSDGSGQIDRSELQKVLGDPYARYILETIHVDIGYLMDFVDMIFQDPESCLSIESIMDLILQFRGDRHATVRDVTEMLAFTHWTTSVQLEQHG